MSPPAHPDADVERPTAVEITGHAEHTDIEGVIESASVVKGRVRVVLMLADGSAAEAALLALEWDWLDLRPGDIVGVRPIIPATLIA